MIKYYKGINDSTHITWFYKIDVEKQLYFMLDDMQWSEIDYSNWKYWCGEETIQLINEEELLLELL